MGVHNVRTVAEFKEALDSHPKVLVDCFATWCGPCKAIAPKLVEWSDDYTDVHFVKLDVDELSELSAELGVRAMPTFFYFEKGDKVEEVVGANPPALEKILARVGTSTKA
ncbi:hypothetical protein G7046_g4509 [Stylonectria norvegica]|nr:hypothetical protein G7046_g4509 [Stylonectria norvegica]